MSDYHSELCRAMALLGERPQTIILGQGVADHGGTSMSSTFRDVPARKRLEMPVAEELQAGMALGMALEGLLPICIFPRWNFMLRAADQIINHLDRLPIYSGGGYKPKVLIRVAVPSSRPFNPQSQHDDDFTVAFGLMCRTINVIQLTEAHEIVPAWLKAADSDRSTILVEFTDRYRNARAATT